MCDINEKTIAKTLKISKQIFNVSDDYQDKINKYILTHVRRKMNFRLQKIRLKHGLTTIYEVDESEENVDL